MSKQPKERILTDSEREAFIKAEAEFNAGPYLGQVIFDKDEDCDMPIKQYDAETFDFIKTLREIYHSVESGVFARRMALECLDRHQISVSWDNDNIKPG